MQSDVPPVSELRFFDDRNLGARILPGILRATARGFLLLCSDSAMASVPPEAQMIHMCSARVFAITRKNVQLRAYEQAGMYLYSELKIRQLAMREGPYSFAVSRSGLREQRLVF